MVILFTMASRMKKMSRMWNRRIFKHAILRDKVPLNALLSPTFQHMHGEFLIEYKYRGGKRFN
jgi:hypothetical protein